MKSYEVGFVNSAFEKEKECQENKNELTNKEYESGELETGFHSKHPEEEKSGKDPDPTITESASCMRIAKTVALTFSLVSLGLFLEIAGPSFDYLEDLIGGTTEEVSRVLVARSVGYLIGSLAGGYICDRFSHLVDIFFGVSFLLAGIGTAVAPWCNDIVLLGFMFFLQGVAQGTICTGSDSVAIKLWGENTGAPLVSQHLAFGVGALVAPQVVNAFIRELETETVTQAIPYSTMLPIELSTSEGSNSDFSDVKYAYIIVGILALCFAVLFFVFFFIDKDSKKGLGRSLDYREILHPGSCADGDTAFSILFFTFFFLMYIHIVGGERTFSKYFFKYTTDSKMNFSETKAANIMSLFWICFTAGRAVNMAVAHCMSPVIIMAVVVSGNVVNGVLFAIWGNESETLIWVLSGTCGFFLSPLFPTGLVWANLYLQVTAVGVSLGYVGSAVGDIIYQYLGGFLFDDVGPESLMYLLFGYSILLAVTYIILQIIASKHGRRHGPKHSTNIQSTDDVVVIVTMSKKY